MSVRAIAAVASLGICGLLTPQAGAQLPLLPPAPLPTVPLPPAPLPLPPPPSLLPPPKGTIATPSKPGLHVSPTRSDNRPGVTLTFWLARPALIELLIRQEAPICRVWGTLSKRGERGLNRVRFRGRIHGKRLPPGTYRIRAEAIRGEREKSLGAVTLVIASRPHAIGRARAQGSAC